MAAALGIGVREFVDKDECRPPFRMASRSISPAGTAAILDGPPRQDLQSLKLGLGLGAAMRLDHAADHTSMPMPSRRLLCAADSISRSCRRRARRPGRSCACRATPFPPPSGARRARAEIVSGDGHTARSLSPLGQRVEGEVELQHVDRGSPSRPYMRPSVFCATSDALRLGHGPAPWRHARPARRRPRARCAGRGHCPRS